MGSFDRFPVPKALAYTPFIRGKRMGTLVNILCLTFLASIPVLRYANAFTVVQGQGMYIDPSEHKAPKLISLP